MGVSVPWPLSNNPGLKPQEGTGKLVNVFVEPKADGSPVWRRSPGATVFARTPSSGSISMEIIVNARSATLFSTFYEFVASSTFQFGAASTVAVTYPTGTVSGDIVFLQTALHDQTTVWVAPTGFTALVESATGTFMGYSLYYKASTGETTVAFPMPSTTGAGVTLAYTIRGPMSTAPICDTTGISTGATGDPDAPDLTLTTADGLLSAHGWLDDDNVTSVTAPTTFGHRLFAISTGSGGSAGCSVMVAFSPQGTTGSIAVSSFGTDGDDEWAAATIAMRHD